MDDLMLYTSTGVLVFSDPGSPIYDSVVVDLDLNPLALRRPKWSIEEAEARLMTLDTVASGEPITWPRQRNAERR